MKALKIFLFYLAAMLPHLSAANQLFLTAQVSYKRVSSDISNDTARINYLAKKGFEIVMKQGMHGIVKGYIDSAMIICNKKKIDIPPVLHLLKAEYYFSTGDYTNSQIEASAALQKAENDKEPAIMARTLINMGRYYHRTGFYSESLKKYDESIALARKHRLKGLIPWTYEREANVFMSLSDIRNYRNSLQLMIEASSEENDSLSLERGFYRLGTSYADTVKKFRNYRMADSLLRRANRIALFKKDTTIITLSLANLGWNFYVEKMYDSSLFYYNNCVKYSLKGKEYGSLGNSYGNIGTIYRDLGYPEKSIEYYLKAIEMAKKVNDWYGLSWIYKDMSDMYLRSNDTSKAFRSYVYYKQFDDSLKVKLTSQGMIDARIRYEADTHNKEVELLSLRLKNNRLLNYGFTIFIILNIVIGILILRSSQHKSRQRISEMNRQISEITQANLRQQMNPHFIFNTLNSIQYYMYQHDKLATNNYLTKFSNLMRKVLENSQHTSIPLSDELNALNLYLELESIRFKDKFEYKIRVDEEIDPLMYKVPAMLIQPYVENSISHGLMPKTDKGSVIIDLKLEKDYLLCTIEDNGIGRDAAREHSIRKDDNHNSLGTQITSSRLDLVNALYGTTLRTVYTDLKKENGEPAGTRVEIHIPIMT
jgi:tetratricopeptide (TPR) repeat protein